MRHVGGQKRRGSEWWNEEVGGAVTEKRIDRVINDRYQAQRVAVKWVVKLPKKLTGDEESNWGMISRVTKKGKTRGKLNRQGMKFKGCEWSNIVGWCLGDGKIGRLF